MRWVIALACLLSTWGLTAARAAPIATYLGPLPTSQWASARFIDHDVEACRQAADALIQRAYTNQDQLFQGHTPHSVSVQMARTQTICAHQSAFIIPPRGRAGDGLRDLIERAGLVVDMAEAMVIDLAHPPSHLLRYRADTSRYSVDLYNFRLAYERDIPRHR